MPQAAKKKNPKNISGFFMGPIGVPIRYSRGETERQIGNSVGPVIFVSTF